MTIREPDGDAAGDAAGDAVGDPVGDAAGVEDPFDGLDLSALRRRSGVKWHAVEPDVLPSWVADMDFAPPPAVSRALHRLVSSGDLGYPDWPRGTPLREAFAERMLSRYAWDADSHRVREICDLIQGLQLVLHLGTSPGDTVAVQTPTYPPFLATITGMGRQVLPIPAVDTGGGWTFDVDGLRARAEAARCRVLLLVNPHNPTGRVLSVAELTQFADVADELDLLVVADEIHADLTYRPHRHVPFASLRPSTAARTVTVTSATKAFNLAGIRCAMMHVGPDRLLAAHDRQPPDLFGQVNLFGVAATLAAWQESEGWLTSAVDHLDRNRHLVASVLQDQLPLVRTHLAEAGYLAWLDFRALGLGHDPAAELLRRGRVQLSPGPTFGPGGEGYARLNFATSRNLLAEILDRVATGFRT